MELTQQTKQSESFGTFMQIDDVWLLPNFAVCFRLDCIKMEGNRFSFKSWLTEILEIENLLMETQNNSSFERKKPFMCGVVEGFYGRPWTSEQRFHLFTLMKKWGMDSYLYAPKDDYKHRAFWRELYTVEEADHLGSLITAAKESGITFFYAISPGLDITYSSSKDVITLKRKLEQVVQLGCNAFAILFDDIDAEMTKPDKEVFTSFAHAQVSVTNEVFQHLNSPKFLFCPTQYCANRAVPNVQSSDYLKTLGSKLDLAIDIMWTGPKVISKYVTIESIEEITDVLRRPPVIWDNLHANDYDHKRIFLGPYAGRSPELISRLNGVLTNPNCEYGANFVAIHTLAQWSRCSVGTEKTTEQSLTPDAKLEAQTEGGSITHIPENLDAHVYHPGVALRNALEEWLEEFKRSKTVLGPIVKPQPCVLPINVLTTTNNVTSTTQSNHMIPSPLPDSPFSGVSCSVRELTNGVLPLVQATTAVMNSLAEEDKIVCPEVLPIQRLGMNFITPNPTNNSREIVDSKNDKLLDLNSQAPLGLEPMDCNATPPCSSPSDRMLDSATHKTSEDVLMLDRTNNELSATPSTESLQSVSAMASDNENDIISPEKNLASSSSSTMQVEPFDDDSDSTKSIEEDSLNVADLHLLCDLFYLPYEHGSQGLQILNEFQWLKTNAIVVVGISNRDKAKPEVAEWFDRARKFEEMTSSLDRLLNKLNMISNRELLYELYPYIWDMRGVVSLLNSYIKWLAWGQFPTTMTSYVHGSYTWFSKGWRESFTSGDQEPWVIRGGLTAELQRLIPVDRGTDLYVYKAPDIPSCRSYTIRNYRASDEAFVYKVCTATFKDGLSAAEEFDDCPKLAGDLKVGGFLSLNAELSFVVEDENEVIVAIAVGATNAEEFRQKMNANWIPLLKERYPLSLASTSNNGDAGYLKDILASLNSEVCEVPEQVISNHPAELRIAMIAPLVDPSVSKRLMTCALAAFRANGIFGCFVEIHESQKYFLEFYKKLGFSEIHPNYLGRCF